MKVIIVDDELPIREWIRMMVQKVDPEIDVVACVSSGEEAFQAFNIHRADLIISDIKMGTMDGIELLKKVKGLEPETYFVLLTSHNDFDYARDGIRYGAREYILKTEVTLESIAKIIDNFRNYQEKDIKKIKKEYVEDVFFSSDYLGKKEKGKNIGQNYYVLGYCSEYDNLNNNFAFSEKVNVVGNFYDREERQYFIYQASASLSQASQYNEVYYIAKNIATVHNLRVGFSGVAYDVQEGIQKARIALKLTFYQEGPGVSTYSKSKDEEIQKQILELRQQCIKEIYNDNIDRVIKVLEDILQLVRNNKYHEVGEVKNILVDVLHAYKLSVLSTEQEDLCNIIENSKTKILESDYFEEMYGELSILFSQKEDNLVDSGQYSVYTKKAIIFIKENYNKNISLIDIVEKLNINSEYFCRVFKKETGKTFLTYLTDYKMKKAQELLIKSDYSIQEISDKLGYTSVAYFSRVFKNKTGENPYKYRNQ